MLRMLLLLLLLQLLQLESVCLLLPLRGTRISHTVCRGGGRQGCRLGAWVLVILAAIDTCPVRFPSAPSRSPSPCRFLRRMQIAVAVAASAHNYRQMLRPLSVSFTSAGGGEPWRHSICVTFAAATVAAVLLLLQAINTQNALAS